MSKLLATLVAVMFALGTVSGFAADAKKEGTKDVVKVDCKDPKNKDNKDCVAAAAKKADKK